MTDDREVFKVRRDAGLAKRHETREARAILRGEWKAQPEDTIGGWCVTLAAIPGTPASGNPPIADFCTQEIAEHIARLHNAHLGSFGLKEAP
jgi:hypothetical protein